MNNTRAKRRDFVFFILLAVMIKVALSKKQLPQGSPSLFAPATTADTSNSSFHEPDQKLMKQLTNLNNQIETALDTPDLGLQREESLLAMQKRLSYLFHKYEYSSPVFALLGPIASMGIVLQEQSLEKELNDIETKLSAIAS